MGSTIHYLKKFYLDKTTKLDFVEYYMLDGKYTANMLYGVTASAYGFALNTDLPIPLEMFFSMLSVGYTADSIFNKAADKK
jgi:hypothetical protein